MKLRSRVSFSLALVLPSDLAARRSEWTQLCRVLSSSANALKGEDARTFCDYRLDAGLGPAGQVHLPQRPAHERHQRMRQRNRCSCSHAAARGRRQLVVELGNVAQACRLIRILQRGVARDLRSQLLRSQAY